MACGGRTACMTADASAPDLQLAGAMEGGSAPGGACGTVDLVQSIADLGGASCPTTGWDTTLAWLDDASYPWKDLAISEY